MKPLVSIVVPVYNAQNYINKGIECLLAQTYKNIEIICIDNNSKDNSLSVLKAWEEKYINIKVIEEKRQGAPCARNSGTLVANGEWIQYLDIDDYLYPNKIEHQINLSDRNSNVDVIFEGWEMILFNGEKRKHEILEDVWRGIFNGRIGHTNSVLIKKKKILEIGAWDESLKSSQERDLFFRILKTNPNYILSDNFGSIFKKRKGSITTTIGSVKGNTTRFVQLRKRILDYLIEFRPEQFEKHKTWYLSLFMEGLTFLYKCDPILSVELYEKYCKNEKLEPIGSLSGKYLEVLKIAGFRLTEKLHSLTQKIRIVKR